MMMKKIAIVLIVFMILASLTSCVQKTDPNQAEPVVKKSTESVEAKNTESTEEKSTEPAAADTKPEEIEENEMMDFSLPATIQVKQSNVSYGTLTKIEYESTTVGCTRESYVLLPPNYDAKEKYPVLFLLHGIGGDQNEWLSASPVEVMGNLTAEGEAMPMIVVIPNVRARLNDDANPSDIFTLEHFQAFDNFMNDLKNDLLPYIESHYNIKEGRENRAIAGLSMGGREALYIGLTMQDTFGSIGAFSPAFGLLPYSNNNVTEAGLLGAEGFKLQEGFKETFIMIATGDNDQVVRDEPLKYHQAFVNNGVEHLYYEVAGGHDFTVWTNGLYHFAKAIFM